MDMRNWIMDIEDNTQLRISMAIHIWIMDIHMGIHSWIMDINDCFHASLVIGYPVVSAWKNKIMLLGKCALCICFDAKW